MDIVLNTNFNNPNLPVVAIPGIVDSFNRPAADILGVTEDSKTWEILNSGTTSSVWGTYGDGTAGMKDSSSQYHLAVADALSSNGTLTAVLETVDGSTRRPGLAVRVVDNDNWINIAPISNTDNRVRVTTRVAGISTSDATIGPVMEAGDTLTVVLDGPSITVMVNGVQVITASDPNHINATKHGLYAFTGAIGTWDSIEFVAA